MERLKFSSKDCLASSLIAHLADLIREVPLLGVVIYMRVSTYDQRRNQNLRNRRRWLRRELKRMGIPCLRVFEETNCGRTLNGRPQLDAAIEHARSIMARNPGRIVPVVTDARKPSFGRPARTKPLTA
jgi:hypothetical protein